MFNRKKMILTSLLHFSLIQLKIYYMQNPNVVVKDTKINKNKTFSLTLRNLKSKKENLKSGARERQINFTVKQQEP